MNDVQAELDKEVSNDWEAEIKQLKAKHDCEIKEMKTKYEHEMKQAHITIDIANHERDVYKAQMEVVELIFGGK